MSTCPYRHAKHPENTLFCDECGAYFLGGNREETEPWGLPDMTWMDREETSEVVEEDITFPS